MKIRTLRERARDLADQADAHLDETGSRGAHNAARSLINLIRGLTSPDRRAAEIEIAAEALHAAALPGFNWKLAFDATKTRYRQSAATMITCMDRIGERHSPSETLTPICAPLSLKSAARMIEMHCLFYLAECVEPDFAVGLKYLTADDIGTEWIRAALRSLRERGLVKFCRGLWTEDGEPAGSGYALTDAGRAAYEAFDALPAADEIALYEFAGAMHDKLVAARGKHGDDWRALPANKLAEMLLDHTRKGDPVDVANFAMMLAGVGVSGNGGSLAKAANRVPS